MAMASHKFVAKHLCNVHRYIDQSVMPKLSDKPKKWCSVQNKLKVKPKMTKKLCLLKSFFAFFHLQELSKLSIQCRLTSAYRY